MRRRPVSLVVRAALAVGVVAGACLLGPAGAATAMPTSVDTASPGRAAALTVDWRVRMLGYVNQLRADAGAPPVRMCPALRRSAERYARQMATTGVVAHVGPDGSTALQRMSDSGYRASIAGETLAAGQDTVVQVMRAWGTSPSHYAAITDPRVRHVGFGHADSATTGYSEYWVQHLGAGGSCR